MEIKKTIATLSLGMLLAAPMSASAASYTMDSITELGRGEAVSVNSQGVVAGHNSSFAYTWSNGSFNRFGYNFTESSEVVAINDNGTVLGKDTGSGKNFTYNPNSGIAFSNIEMRATGINNAGKIVGYNHDTGEAIMVENSVKKVLKGIDRAYGINESDQVVGMIWDGPGPDGWQRGVVYDNGNVTVLGALGDNPDMSFGDVINNNGDVIGTTWRQDWGGMTSYFWAGGSDPNALTEVPNVAGNDDGSTYLYGMNDNGWLVGKSREGNNEWGGVLFDGEELIDLNLLAGFTVSDEIGAKFINNVLDINEDGVLVGTIKEITGSNYGDEIITAFVMDVNAVPVPGAVWLLGSGLIALVGFNRRKES